MTVLDFGRPALAGYIDSDGSATRFDIHTGRDMPVDVGRPGCRPWCDTPHPPGADCYGTAATVVLNTQEPYAMWDETTPCPATVSVNLHAPSVGAPLVQAVLFTGLTESAITLSPDEAMALSEALAAASRAAVSGDDV